MTVATKITLPKLAPNTKPYASAFKLVLAAQLAGSKIKHVAGDVVALELPNQVALLESNVAVK